MTLIDDTLATDREQSEAPSSAHPTRTRLRQPRRRIALGAAALAVAAAGLAVVALAETTDWPDGSDVPIGSQAFMRRPTVVGTGPDAVYVGPAPQFGGDPARGETQMSYFTRTGHHLPGLRSAMPVEGPWWHGPAPVHGGDPAPGETDSSYFARTGRHLPSQRDAREAARRRQVTRDLVARGLIPAATLDDAAGYANSHVTGP